MVAGGRAIAVVFLHAYQNGDHEARARDLIEREFPECSVSISSELSPGELRMLEAGLLTINCDRFSSSRPGCSAANLAVPRAAWSIPEGRMSARSVRRRPM